MRKRLTLSISAIIIASLLLVSILTGCAGGGKSHEQKVPTTLKEKVLYAQYLPTAENLKKSASKKYTSSVTTSQGSMSVANRLGEASQDWEDGNLIVSKNEYTSIVESLGTLDGTGCGKYQGYNIYEIKKEIATVLSYLPSLGKWYRMPTMREEQGYSEIPYYEWWAYLADYDAEADRLTVTRVCWGTRFQYLDFDNQKTIEYYGPNESIIQYQVMRTEYYKDELDREVVECYLYTVAVDHRIVGTGATGHYNANTQDYHTVELQYLKNVKDASLTKYNLTISERYNDEHSFDEGGWDITNNAMGGSTRNLLRLDYGEQGLQHLIVSQTLPTVIYNRPQTTNISFYNVYEGIPMLYVSAYDYSDIDTFDIFNVFTPYYNSYSVFRLLSTTGWLEAYDRYDYPEASYSLAPSRGTESIANDNGANIYPELNKAIGRLASAIGAGDEAAEGFLSATQGLSLDSLDLTYETAFDIYLNAICIYIQHNFALESEWPQIFYDSDNAIQLEISDLNGGINIGDISLLE